MYNFVFNHWPKMYIGGYTFIYIYSIYIRLIYIYIYVCVCVEMCECVCARVKQEMQTYYLTHLTLFLIQLIAYASPYNDDDPFKSPI